ncbi:3-ketoacyl-CoA thiolase [Chlamydiales bacterium STE3]|nr:3-ketoacyl-CoA thiolase [Chlamydiales bacterium STE3]
MTERVAIVMGIRTPFCKANGVFKDFKADELGAAVIRELAVRANFPLHLIDEVIMGNVLQPSHATNIARVAAVKAGIPESVPAYTVNRNCASGMEAITSGADKIRLGHAEVILAGGMESMSNFPILFPKGMKDFLMGLSKAKTLTEKLKLMASFRPGLLKPQIPEIADPLCGLNMGQTAENLSRDFKILREEQDAFALKSQLRASKATQEGIFKDEIIPLPIPPKYNSMQVIDEGPRSNQTLAALAKLRPVFDPLTGSVTAGNSSPITDGAACVILMKEEKAKALGLQPLGYIKEYASAGLDPSRMGLGPVYATAKLLSKTQLKVEDFDLIEINEAFAAQALAVVKAFESEEFAKAKLGREKALGKIDMEKLNVNGGAIALGHPLGASGARLILTLLNELRRRGKHLGLATLCVGGGQGEACIVEVE